MNVNIKGTEMDRQKMCPNLNNCKYQEIIINDRPPDIPT